MIAYVYDLSSVLLEVGARYTHGDRVDQPLIVERGGREYFHHADLGSSIVLWSDTAVEAACVSSFDSFGRIQTCQDPPSPYGFAGREYDSETGLYYMRARY